MKLLPVTKDEAKILGQKYWLEIGIDEIPNDLPSQVQKFVDYAKQYKTKNGRSFQVPIFVGDAKEMEQYLAK